MASPLKAFFLCWRPPVSVRRRLGDYARRAPSARVVGSPIIRDGRFRTRYNAVILAVARNGERLRAKIGDVELRAGDTLLLESGPNFLQQQRNSRDFLLVSELQGVTIPRHDRIWIAVGILGVMVALASTGLPMLEAGLVASALMIAARCIKPSAARASIDWSVLVVIGASFGIGQALDTTGVAQALADFWLGAAGTNPLLALAAVYVVTNVVTEMVSNNAAAVMAFPIAVATAESLGVSLWPFVDRLPARERTTLYLRYRVDLSFEQIGDVMGIKPGAARAYASRGLERLRAQLGGAGEFER